MADVADRLLDLARSRFSDLTPPDEQLLVHAADGSVADFGGPPHEEVDGEQILPWDEASWSPDQTVRSHVLRWLCSDAGASSLVDLRGVQIRGALIAERLDLAYANVPFPLEFANCAFPAGIDVSNGSLRTLSLQGSRCRDFDTDQATFGFNLTLMDSRIEGQVSLAHATISGQLSCSGTTLINPEGDALNGQSMTVKKDVFLRDDFWAEGRVSLSGAEIGGQLSCSGATLIDPGSDALNGQSMTVKEGVFLDDGFRAEGRVSLSGAEIRGHLSCRGATLIYPGGDALNGESMTVKGNVFLDEDFSAAGRVSLAGAEIGGQLSFSGATLVNPISDALVGQSMIVGTDVFLDEGFRAAGRVSLWGAGIGGQLSCRDAKLINPKGDALFGESMVVRGGVILTDGFRAEGRVSLSGAEIGGQLSCRGAKLVNPEGDALFGQSITVKTDVLFSDEFRAEGRVSLSGSDIGGRLTCKRGMFASLDLRNARIGTLDDDASTVWPKRGLLWLEGLTYRSIAGVPDDSTKRKEWVDERLNWIRRQPGYAPQPYTQLSHFLIQEGHEEEARIVAIARQDDLRRLGRLPRWAWLRNILLSWTIAHGYRPWRPIPIGIIVMLIGWIVFSWAEMQGLLMPIPADHSSSFNALIYSIDVFLPVVDFGEQERRQPTGGGTDGGFVQWFYWGVIALGWFISTLFVLSFTRLVRQD